MKVVWIAHKLHPNLRTLKWIWRYLRWLEEWCPDLRRSCCTWTLPSCRSFLFLSVRRRIWSRCSLRELSRLTILQYFCTPIPAWLRRRRRGRRCTNVYWNFYGRRCTILDRLGSNFPNCSTRTIEYFFDLPVLERSIWIFHLRVNEWGAVWPWLLLLRCRVRWVAWILILWVFAFLNLLTVNYFKIWLYTSLNIKQVFN